MSLGRLGPKWSLLLKLPSDVQFPLVMVALCSLSCNGIFDLCNPKKEKKKRKEKKCVINEGCTPLGFMSHPFVELFLLPRVIADGT